MADYKISLGAELRTKDIDTAVKGYKGKINVGVNVNTGDIDREINSYKSIKKIEVDSKLNTKGITDVINKYQAKKPIKINSELNTSGIESTLGAYTAKTPIKVDVQLNKSSINQEISSYNQGEHYIQLDAKLKNDAINAAIDGYQAKKPIKIKVEPDFNGINTKISDYQVRSVLKVNVKLNKTSINEQITNFKTSKTIELGAKLKDDAIEGAVRKYSAKEKVPITVDFKVGETKEIDAKISTYKNTPVEVPVKLKPAAKGFDTGLMNKPVKVSATLDPNDINTAIDGFAPTSKIKVDVRLVPKDINGQIPKLPKPTEALDVDVKLDNASINQSITNFKPSSKFNVGVKLDTDDVNAQIEAYKPSTPIKVDVKINDNDIDEKTGAKNIDAPIQVNVKLDRDGINDQIKKFTPTAKMKVGVKLDFASHKDDSGKEIQRGIAKQIKDYETKTKVKVGVELDKNSINQEIQNVQIDTPVGVKVEFTPESVQKVYSQIDDIRQRLDNIGSINLNINGDVGNRSGRTGGNASIDSITNGGKDIPTVRIARGVDDVTRAYRQLISIQNRMSSKQQAVAKLDTTKNKQEILELSSQIDELARKYQRIHQLFSGQFSSVQVDTLNRNFEIAGEKLSVIKSKALDAKDSLDKMSASGKNVNVYDSDTLDIKNQTQAYKDLMGVLNELNSKRLQLNGLDASSPQSSEKIQRLRLQIEQLDNEYNNLLHSFDVQGIQFTADQWNQLETVMARVGRQIDVVQAGMSDKSVIKNQTQAYKELLSISKEIGSLEINIAKLKGQGGNSNQIEVLENQLKTLQSTYQQLVTSMDAPLTSDQWGSIYTQIAKTQEELDRLQAKFVDTRVELAKGVKLKFDDGDFNVLPKINSEAKKLAGSYSELSTAYPKLAIGIKEVETAIADMEAAIGTGDEIAEIDKLISAYNRYEHALTSVNNELNANKVLKKDSVDAQKLSDDIILFQNKIDAYLTKNSAAAKQFGSELLRLRTQAQNCDRVTLNHLEAEFKQVDKAVEAAGKRMQTFPDRLKTQFQKYSSYLSVASLIMYATQAMRSMFEQVKLIDSAMTELKKVTDETDESYNKFLTNAASRAKEIGTTIDGLVASTADFARLGYGFEDSQKLAEVANIYAVVGDEIEGVEGATQSLISTLAAFRDKSSGISDADFAMDIIDIFNELGNKFAISSGGLGEALERSASSLEAANNTLHESAALITAGNEVVQNPEKVGTALKTISMRIRGKIFVPIYNENYSLCYAV